MNKLIQAIVLTTVVVLPLSLISLVTSAAAHHTASHVSTVAMSNSKTNKMRAKGKKKPMTMGNRAKKPVATKAAK
jgi:hypothetical protein